MADNRTNARTTMDRWRAHGADRVNPIRFHFIEALERRTAELHGEARRLLDARLTHWLAVYADEVATADRPDPGAEVDDAVSAPLPVRGALAALVDELSRHKATTDQPAHTPDPCRVQAPRPELEALTDFRRIWSSARVESQLRQALERVPAHAGPLNSASLVHRSLALMNSLSTGYLQQFLSYVDVLSWIEQMQGGIANGKEGARATSPGKRARRKPRERREQA